MQKVWRIHSHDPQAVAQLQRSTDLPALVAHLLICRGITVPETAIDFLNPKLTGLRDPSELPGVSDAVAVISEEIAAGHKIIVYGDYDVDGMTSTSILLRCLRLLGADVDYYIPHRFDEGYGLNCEAMKKIASEGAHCVITVDCGVTSAAEAAVAREAGLRLIITDHHLASSELPQADAVVHPALPNAPYPFAGLTGAGVAFKLAWALCQKAAGEKRVTPPMRKFLLQAVSLAAMGTIADVAPLVDENRVLVRHALDQSLRTEISVGLARLMKVSGMKPGMPVTGEDIGFALSPRLNAAGRLGQARLAVELLSTEREDRAQELAEYINGLNETRKKLERSIYRAASKQVKEMFPPEQHAGLVLAERGWHQGVIGIIAGRIAERYHRPSVLLTMDQLGAKPATGSARSVPGFDLHAALDACSEYLIGFGGHAAAAGLRIEESKIDDFRHAFDEYVSSEWREEERVAEIEIDAEFPLSAFTQSAVRQIEWLAPFGVGNRKPVLCTSGATISEPPKHIGGGDRHMTVRLKQGGTTMRAVAFGHGEWVGEMSNLDQPIDIAFRPVLNSFAGRTNVELHLVDWRVQEDG